MTVEIRPLGVACNIRCHYCYQNPQRDAGNIASGYDLALIKTAVSQENAPFTLFGGEALLAPIDDLEALWAWGFQKYGRNGIQTNGVLINDEHIRLFKQHNVHVGLSIDGPGELNDARWAGSLERTRAATAKTEAAIERLCHAGLPPSLIITLHRGNAVVDKLPVLNDWLHQLDKLGVSSARIHILEIENDAVRRDYGLLPDENIYAFQNFISLEAELNGLTFDIFTDMRRLLLGEDERVTCVWNACDPYTTRAVRGIEGDGQRSNCGRTNKEGINFAKADREGFERYLALYATPQQYHGCAGCRFFLMCKGQCPGTAVHHDWRNRSEHCPVWFALFAQLEDTLLSAGHAPISQHPQRRQLEAIFIAAWQANRYINIKEALAQLQSGQNGKSRDTHGGYKHGDHTNHGDHTDSTDAATHQRDGRQGDGRQDNG